MPAAEPPKRGALDPATVLALQRTAGNAAVAALLADAGPRRETPADAGGRGRDSETGAQAARGVLLRKPAHARAAHAAPPRAAPPTRGGSAKTKPGHAKKARSKAARVRRRLSPRAKRALEAFRNRAHLIRAMTHRPTAQQIRLACRFLDASAIDEILAVGRALRNVKPTIVQTLEGVAKRVPGIFQARLAVALAAVRLRGQISRIDFASWHARQLAALRRRARKDVEPVLVMLGPKPRELVRMRTCTGFLALSAFEQRRLTYIVGGSTEISKAGAPAMRAFLLDPTARSDPARFRAFVTNGLFRPRLIGPSRHQRLPEDRFALVSDQFIGPHTFDTGAAPARRRDARITGKTATGTPSSLTIPIIVPVNPPGALERPIDIAEALAAIPVEHSRSKILSVELNAVTAGTAYMHVNSLRPGVVSVFPLGRHGVNIIATALMHETGHLASIASWGAAPAQPPWNEWRGAMSVDALVVSQYATTDEHEDFAESWALWAPNRGGPRMNELNAIIPQRIAVMERLASGAPPPA